MQILEMVRQAERVIGELVAFVPPEGDGLYLEFGVASGTTIHRIAVTTKNKVYGFDSFQGLPEDWEGYIEVKGAYACDIPTGLPENVELVVGLFEDTLPKFLKKHKENVTFLHIDCDIYSSTKCIFDNLKKRIVPGTVIAFDELYGYPNWEQHEYKAFKEFLAETKYKVECIGKFGAHQAAFKIL